MFIEIITWLPTILYVFLLVLVVSVGLFYYLWAFIDETKIKNNLIFEIIEKMFYRSKQSAYQKELEEAQRKDKEYEKVNGRSPLFGDVYQLSKPYKQPGIWIMYVLFMIVIVTQFIWLVLCEQMGITFALTFVMYLSAAIGSVFFLRSGRRIQKKVVLINNTVENHISDEKLHSN